MASTVTTLQILVASPSDATEEQRIAREVIEDLNVALHGSRIRFELLQWKTHSRPGLGQGGQDVINQQFGEEYDVLVGIMWMRFGSPTNRAESGTEEEFNRALARSQRGERVEIMFYFKASGPKSLEDIDIDQLKKVQAFKERIRKHGLQHEFSDGEEFRRKLHMHLGAFGRDWQSNHTVDVPQPEHTAAEATGGGTATEENANPLAHLSALNGDEEDDNYGLIELVEQTIDAMNATTAITGRITDATRVLGEQIKRRGAEMNALEVGQSMNQRKRIVNNSANDLEQFVKRLSVEIPELYAQQATAMDALGRVVTAPGTDLTESREAVDDLCSHLRGYRDGLRSAETGVEEFRGAIAGVPRLTGDFIRARRRTIAVIDDLLAQIERAIRQVGNVEQLLAPQNSRPELRP